MGFFAVNPNSHRVTPTRNGVGNDAPDTSIARAHQHLLDVMLAPIRQAQERKESARFEEMDTNNDGKVTRDELTKGLLGSGDRSTMNLLDQLKAEQLADFALQRYDLDGDDAISVNPSLKRQERLGAQNLKHLDLNGDGRISSQELHKKVGDDVLGALLLNRLDLDHDGCIDVGK